MEIVSKEDFGDLSKFSSLSPLDCLAIVAQKALEKEGFNYHLNNNNSPQNHHPKRKRSKKPALNFDLNLSPTNNTTELRPFQIFQRVVDEDEQVIMPPPKPKKIKFKTNRSDHHETLLGSNPLSWAGPSPPPDLPMEFRDKIIELGGGSNPNLVFQKKLFPSDVAKGQGRLMMPMRQCRLELTQAEWENTALRDVEDCKKIIGLEVNVIDPTGLIVVDKPTLLKRWSECSNYILCGSWNDIVSTNNLTPDDFLQVWSFRVTDKLYFALVKIGSASSPSSSSSHDQ